MGTECLFLAGKVEETPKPLKEVVLVCFLVQHTHDYERALKHIRNKVRHTSDFFLDGPPATLRGGTHISTSIPHSGSHRGAEGEDDESGRAAIEECLA